MKKEAVSGKDTAFLVQGKIGKISLYAKETRVLDGRGTEYAVEKIAVKKPKFSGELRLIQKLLTVGIFAGSVTKTMVNPST